MTDKSKSTFKTLFKWGDLVLLAVLLVAVALTIWLSLKSGSDDVEIYVDGALKYNYDINVDREIDLNEVGVNMHVVIVSGSVYVSDSDCAEQLCVHSAKVSENGGMIVCLPNKVVIKVVSKEVDAVT